MKSEPVLIVMSILAALQVAAGSAALTDIVSKDIVGIAIVAIAALQAGLQFYLREKVTPVERVGEDQYVLTNKVDEYVPERALNEE